MSTLDRTWKRLLGRRRRRQRSYGLQGLDRKLAEHLPAEPGFFVELGAHDGRTQSNTLYFEERGWQGLLIEPIPELYERCVRNRPRAIVVNCACVSERYTASYVEMTYAGLMSIVAGARGAGPADEAWVSRGEAIQSLTRYSCKVPARTLTSVLSEHNVTHVDLLSLDVEGYEQEVLDGLDFARFGPTHIVVEESDHVDLAAYLADRGYTRVAVLSVRPYTSDVLYRRTECAEAGR